jgi:hypothetical protein
MKKVRTVVVSFMGNEVFFELIHIVIMPWNLQKTKPPFPEVLLLLFHSMKQEAAS